MSLDALRFQRSIQHIEYVSQAGQRLRRRGICIARSAEGTFLFLVGRLGGWLQGGGTTLVESLVGDVVPLRAHGFSAICRFWLSCWRLLLA
jgi:hypothetical protein